MKKIHRKRLEILADWLERGGETPHIKFNMAIFMSPKDQYGEVAFHVEDICSTACCMAGALTQTFGDREALRRDPIFSLPFFRTARKLTGLTTDQAEDLFTPSNIGPLSGVTAAEAAKVVRHLLATGKVDWRVAGFANKN